MPWALAGVLAVVQTLPLIWVSRWPLMVWAVVAAGLAISTWLGYGQGRLGWPWPAASCAVLVVALYAVVLHRGRRAGAVVGVVTAVVVVIPAAFAVPLPAGVVVLVVAAVAGAVVFGESMRMRREAQQALQGDVARRAVLQERARIAREMHDVVAHHLSLIALQAEAAAYQMPDLPEPAQARFEVLRSVAADGLVEMRRLLGLLRQEDPAPREPVPRLAALPALVEGSRRAGVAVELELVGGVRPLPAGVEVSAYRIVQEALSNAARHAPGAPVHVALDYDDDRLRVRVRNPSRHDPPAARDDATGRGLGLIGMRERVSLLGGTLEAGPQPGGGFLIDAALPAPDQGSGS